jgi:hypothetical protein
MNPLIAISIAFLVLTMWLIVSLVREQTQDKRNREAARAKHPTRKPRRPPTPAARPLPAPDDDQYEQSARSLIVRMDTICERFGEARAAAFVERDHHIAEIDRLRQEISDLRSQLSIAYIEPMVAYVAAHGTVRRHELAAGQGLDPSSSLFTGRLAAAMTWGLIEAVRDDDKSLSYKLPDGHEAERDRHVASLTSDLDTVALDDSTMQLDRPPVLQP